MGKEVVKKAICQMCPRYCRHLVYSDENGHLINIEEDPNFPRYKATWPPASACRRSLGTKEWFYHPDRVNFPLKRVGERGEGKWQRISWEQGLDEVAERLKEVKERYGSESIASIRGLGWLSPDGISNRFLHLLGSPNTIGICQICHATPATVSTAMFGWTVPHRHGSVAVMNANGKLVTKCAFLVGIDPAVTWPTMWKSIRDGKKRGLKLIVADPQRSKTVVEAADLWLQIRPGTDAALLLAVLNVIIEEGLYDKDFVEKWCYGFDKLSERVREYPPERAADACWVPADKIREAARMYATNQPGPAITGVGIEQAMTSVPAIQAAFTLSAITGNIDIAGSFYLSGPGKVVRDYELELSEMLSPEQKAKQIGADQFKFCAWPGRDLMQPYVKKFWGKECSYARVNANAHAPSVYRAMLTGKPYPVRAAITNGTAPILTQPNMKLVYKALKSLDLYVVMDFWMIPSAEIADYVFPAASWLERPYLFDGYGERDWVYGAEAALPAAIPGEYEHRNDYDFFRGLGIRMGQEEYWPWKTLEELCDYRLKPLGMTHKEFMDKGGFLFPPQEYKKYERTGFATPTRKVELYSTFLEKLGYDPLPYYIESHETPVSTPGVYKEYPLVLVSRREHPFIHSQHRNIDSCRRHHPYPLVHIYPETAAKYDIKDKDWVWIETRRGRIKMKCKITDGIAPWAVSVEHAWWYPEYPGEEPWSHGMWESNTSLIADDDPDACSPQTGGWPLKIGLCKISKVKVY